MIQFNGAYGCPYCLDPGERLKTGERGHVLAYPFHLNGQPNEDEVRGAHLTAMGIEKRMHDQTLQFAKEAENLKRSGSLNSTVKGVKGMIWSMFLPGFDIITGVTIDYMHCVLLGITKMLLPLWTDNSYSAQPWYLGPVKIKYDNPYSKESLKEPGTF